MESLQREWEVLHGDTEKYERYSLLIKLCAIISAVFLAIFSVNIIFSLIIVMVFWGQDAIWKTFQSRLGDRLHIVEKAITSGTGALLPTCQLYSEWAKNKPAASGLIKSYLLHSLKPTVCYPYGVLLLMLLYILL